MSRNQQMSQHLFCPKCGGAVNKNGFTTGGRQRYRCSSCGHRTTKPAGVDHIDSVFDRKQIDQYIKGKTSRYIITSAQNATPINEPFFKSLLEFCKHNDAKLIVIPYRYRNPTSVFSDKNYEWWDERLIPYIADTRFNVTDSLKLMGDIKIQPTAAKPLSGMDSLTGLESAIFGHPKVQLKTIATRPGEMAKILTTTGSITIPNYTNSKSGKKGQHHHSYSAVVVEKDVGVPFHLRHVTACKDGSFIDLDTEYRVDGAQPAAPALALVLGDIHQLFTDPDVDRAVFGKHGIVSALKPANVIMHDVMDSYSITHHHRKDPFTRVVKNINGVDSVRSEIEGVIHYLNDRSKFATLHVVSSNHHNHIRQWLSETDWRTDPVNAEFYLETALHLVRNSEMTASGASVPDPFQYWIEKSCPSINLYSGRESLQVADFELGLHGHQGPNGSRGSLNSLSKIGRKVIVGHSHSPGREDGSLCVGTSSRLDLEYASGPSSWLHSHAVIYANGKASLVHVINGKWRKL